ncbi:MAG: hypothetical protein FWE32_07445 [Oscillospiraceae bacterium]|nr:hypothetical protein [Oscillospiraceae bacterium]
MGQELKNLSATFAIAEAIAQGRSQVELAQFASFFLSIGSNISLIVQTRNVEKELLAKSSNAEQSLEAEEAASG